MTSTSEPQPILLMVRELAVGGGCERDLSKLALTIDRKQFTPHVACFWDGARADEIRAAGVPVVRFNIRSYRDPTVISGARHFRSYLHEHRIRLVHAYDLPTSIFAAPAGRWSKTPAVVTSNLGHRELFPLKDRLLAKLSDRFSHRIVVNCEAMRRHLLDDEGVPANKIFLSHNGFMPETFHPAKDPQSRFRPPQFTPEDIVIGIVCVLRAEKNIPLLMQSFADLRRMRPNLKLKLLIVGSGALGQELAAKAVELGINGDTHFEPARMDIADWYRAMDVFVLPSYSEAFPNAVLEAMACGLATIATNVGGIPELITDSETGLLFPNRDQAALTAQLSRCVDDESFRRRLGANAAQSVLSRFTMEHYCARMEAFYGSLLA